MLSIKDWHCSLAWLRVEYRLKVLRQQASRRMPALERDSARALFFVIIPMMRIV
jgi:hypothetical protein